MSQLNEFMDLLTGHFNNKEQFDRLSAEGVVFPFAEHINTICNPRILNLPEDFQGIFMVEESIYTTQGRTNRNSHLFLFTQEEDGILLTSYEIPKSFGQTFTYETLLDLDFAQIHPSEKFTPALYKECNGFFEGGSVSMFSPVFQFTLHERFSKDVLEVSESMEVNGKRTFGFDEPILYKRVG